MATFDEAGPGGECYVLRLEKVVSTQGRAAAETGLQFADIARPIMRQKYFDRLATDTGRGSARIGR